MKKYISAQMNVVRLGNDIVTASPELGSTDYFNGTPTEQGDPNSVVFGAPSRRYRDNYDF